tara:strand:- start:4339 stop:5145 length:807 start_codon:yes stop_codon:yes gene_type:complete
MARRSFDDGFWGDSFVQTINRDAKLLFLYLWTNKRCNSAGLYEITLKTIAFETGIEIEELTDLLKMLSPKITWNSEQNIIWVRNFLKHQPKSPQFLKSVVECIKHINCNGLVTEYLDYYRMQGVSIPYQYPKDTNTIPTRDILELELELDKDIDKDNDRVILPSWVKQETWDAFMEMRKKQKAIPTPLAITLLLGKLEKLKESGNDPNAVLEQSIMNNWKGVFTLHDGDRYGKHKGDNKELGKPKGNTGKDGRDTTKFTSGQFGHMVQ